MPIVNVFRAIIDNRIKNDLSNVRSLNVIANLQAE